MKRLCVVLLSLILFAGTVAAEPAELYCKSVYSGTIAASGSANGEILETKRKSGFEGFFSIQPVGTFTGTLKISYQVSNNGTTWSPAVEIVASAVSGTVYPYPAPGVNIFSGFQRLVFAETGTSDQVVITGAYRCAQ